MQDYWRVEGSLLDTGELRSVRFCIWNTQSYLERWARRGGFALAALLQPLVFASNRVAGTRLLHTLLRGITRDRLDLLGEEYFHYVLRPRLKPDGIEALNAWTAQHGPVVLVSASLEHVMRPLAKHLGVARFLANRLEFRDGVATGRLLEPILPPNGPLATLPDRRPDGLLPAQNLARELNLNGRGAGFDSAILATRRSAHPAQHPLVRFHGRAAPQRLSVREQLAGRHILLIGVTGFIAKVWLVNLLLDLPEIGKVYLLIRRQKGASARRRFEKLVEESPAFDPLHEKYGVELGRFLAERIEVVEGDVSQPGLGLDPAVRERMAGTLDLVVNSAGLVDFNPDLRDALATNVRSVSCLLDFLHASRRAGMLHLSTCYVVGGRDGRVPEKLVPDYAPSRVSGFDAEREWQSLEEMVRKTEERSEGAELTAALRRQALGRRSESAQPPGAELDNLLKRNRARWLRNRLTRAGMKRAKRLGWPNTYTFTKSLAESLIARRGANLPVAIVRPSIVETSIEKPFRGWNEGINTSAPLSYLLGTYFRQLPTNERKRLDIIPVDLVTRGMTLIAAAIVARRHERLYQLATSAANPCDMGRSIELTSLAHRKHYRAQQGLESWLRTRTETIPVSKARYERLSVPAQKAVVRGINRMTAPLLKRALLARQERDLARIEKLIELYEPFILHNEHVFEAENSEWLSAALPPEERAAFSYDPRTVDWWEYWINIHVPALRRWVYPLIEGRAPEARPPRKFILPVSGNGSPSTPANSPWPSS